MIRLTLRPGREASVRRRHPWVFSGAVAATKYAEGDAADGIAQVADASGRPLALGAYSPDSQIVARLWSFDG
ncbi:MAG TPA: 23S rRNA (cytosine(1962)-C(5))-methyltransferase RlmI, partial [Thermoanaerobaculia bacterium]